MFEYDYCFCGNTDQCPHKDECKRAEKVVGIHSYSFFYEEGKECKNFWKKDDKKEVD